MVNKFIELDQTKLIELDVSENECLNIFDINESNIITTINIHVAPKVTLELNMSSLNYNNYKKTFVVNVYIDGAQANVNVKTNCLGLDKSQTNIEVNGVCDSNYDSKINIQIDGIIESASASITGKPKFIFKCNSVDARHGLTIGKVNENELTYLLSRGIKLKNAKYMLISSKLFECLKGLNEKEYEIKKQNILNVWGETNA